MVPEQLRTLLSEIYGSDTGLSIAPDLEFILEKYRGKIPSPLSTGWSERDAILITYPDQVQEPDKPPLTSLSDFCSRYLKDVISGIHILPFYPWSSDDGFSVIDYEAVASQYGQWDDIRSIGKNLRLMFDAVINHCSTESQWFQRFLRGEPEFRDYFIEVQGSPDLSQVVRPRALPLLTEFKTSRGSRKIWTTFSSDQADLNYHNPAVMLSILDVILFYASQGADFIRLDAIAYLWKEPRTSCINLPRTHAIVRLLRAVLDEIAPHVMLITETNVPNLENLSYFGNGSNEAQLVYNFPLPPLVLHAMHTGNASVLSKWAALLRTPSDRVTFLNFLASHDGIGLNPARGILPESEIEGLAGEVEAAGGFISKKTNPDGSESPYELNVNYFDALNDADFQIEPALQVARFVTAHAILLAFVGLPAIYFHSLFGSRGWPEGVRQTGKYRSINRQKLQRLGLEAELADKESLRSQVFAGIGQLLKIRSANGCFSPHAAQHVIMSPSSVLAFIREAPETGKMALCVHSVSPKQEDIRLDLSGTSLAGIGLHHDLITGRQVSGKGVLSLTLSPYESVWLTS